jgi:hypothetical protein
MKRDYKFFTDTKTIISFVPYVEEEEEEEGAVWMKIFELYLKQQLLN